MAHKTSADPIAAAKVEALERDVKNRWHHLLKPKLLAKEAAASPPHKAMYPTCRYSSGLQARNQNKERRVIG